MKEMVSVAHTLLMRNDVHAEEWNDWAVWFDDMFPNAPLRANDNPSEAAGWMVRTGPYALERYR